MQLTMLEQQRLSVVQPPRSGNDYPFLAGGEQLATVVMDMLIQHVATADLPLYLVQANGLQLPATAGAGIGIIIHDREGVVVINTVASTYLGRHSWGEYYTTHRWETADHRLFHLSLGYAAQSGFPASLSPTNLMIDPRTYCPVLPGVSRIQVYDRSSTALATYGPDEIVRLRAGYNTQWLAGESQPRTFGGSRITSSLTLRAVAGLGIGTLDNCGDEESAFVRSFSQQSAGPAGSFLLAGDTCFRFEPVVTFDSEGTAIIEQGRLNIFDDCEPCCDCDDYLAVYLSIQRAKRKSEPVAASLLEIKDRYVVVKDRVETILNCLLTSALRLQVSRAEECQIAIAAGITNPGANPLYFTDLEVIVMKWDGSGWVDATLEYVPGIATRLEQAADIGTTPLNRVTNNVIGANIDCVPPGGTGFVAFRIGLFGNDRLRICVGLPDALPSDYVCREVVSSCTYLPTPAETTTTTTTSVPTTTTTSVPTTTTTSVPTTQGPFIPPSQECWVHFDGAFLSDPGTIADNNTGNQVSLVLREVYTGTQADSIPLLDRVVTTNVVGVGEGMLTVVATEAIATTFDSIAVPTGVTVRFWEDNTKTSLVIELIGPVVVYNSYWNTFSDGIALYGSLLTELATDAWTGTSPTGIPWNTMFPPSVRTLSGAVHPPLSNMHSWSDYYCEIVCENVSTTTTTTSEPSGDVSICVGATCRIAMLSTVFQVDSDALINPPSVVSSGGHIDASWAIQAGERIQELFTLRSPGTTSGTQAAAAFCAGESLDIPLLSGDLFPEYNRFQSLVVPPGGRFQIWTTPAKTTLVADVYGPKVVFNARWKNLANDTGSWGYKSYVENQMAATWSDVNVRYGSGIAGFILLDVHTMFPPASRVWSDAVVASPAYDDMYDWGQYYVEYDCVVP